MADQKDRKHHLYLVFDDWHSGYSIRKVSLSRRSGKRRSQSSDDSSGDEGSEPLPGKGARPPLPLFFVRVSAERGYLEFFASGFGTKIMAMHPRALDDIGVPTIDVLDRTCTSEIQPNNPAAPTYIPVGDDMLFALDIGSFEVLRKPERSGQPWEWQNLTPCPPFPIWDVSSYGVQPDGCILVSTKRGTFIFDTKEYVWKLHGDWVFPFTGRPFAGRGHYDPSLKDFVGLSKDPETLGYLYCCTVTGDTGNPTNLKCTKHTVYNKNPAEGQHVSATLVYMRPGRFCLVECVSIDDTVNQEEFRVPPGPDQDELMGGGPQGGRFMYRLKTFSLGYDIKGDCLELKHCKVRCYSLPHEARGGTIRQDPVAFWL